MRKLTAEMILEGDFGAAIVATGAPALPATAVDAKEHKDKIQTVFDFASNPDVDGLGRYRPHRGRLLHESGNGIRPFVEWENSNCKLPPGPGTEAQMELGDDNSSSATETDGPDGALYQNR